MRARPKISPKQPRVKGSCHQTARESDIIEPMASREITLETKAAGAHTRELIHRARRLPLVETEWLVEPPRPGWALGMVSWVALDGEGVAYMLQRGDRAAPVIALDTQGRVLRSWGDGLYELPHAIRVDPAGAIWTVDAATSTVRKFTPRGATLLQIDVGGQPAGTGSRFNGATDVAFGPDGRVFIADGYGNARILEYTTRGRKVREWGSPGSGPASSVFRTRSPSTARRSTSPIERTGESSSSIWRASTWTSSPSARRTLSRWRAALCGPRFTPWISPRHHPDGS